MKKLFLIRHCETNQFEENTEDHKKKLNDNGLEDANILNQWFDKNKFSSIKKKILYMLKVIGYDTSLALKNKIYFDQLINAYSSHYRIYKNYYYNKKKIFDVIEVHFLNIILTKNKK